MSALDRLLERVPAPPERAGAREDWGATERSLETALPSDFKQMVDAYGPGTLCGHIYWFTPSSPHSMRSEVDELLEAYLSLRDVLPEACPWPAFPEPGGLLPWARTSNREELYWVTKGEPDEWIVVAADLPETTVHAITTTEFVLGWVEGALETAVSIWPAVQPGVEPFFRPLARSQSVAPERLMVWFAESSLPYDERVEAVRAIFGPAKKRERGIAPMGVFTRIERADVDWVLLFSSREPGVESATIAPPQSLGITLPSSDIDDAKERVARLSQRIGAPITKAYRSDDSVIWPDLVTAV
jgi:hypothetical protein